MPLLKRLIQKYNKPKCADRITNGSKPSRLKRSRDCRKQVQYLRDKGMIPFKKLDSITYYKLEEIEQLMNAGKLNNQLKNGMKSKAERIIQTATRTPLKSEKL